MHAPLIARYANEQTAASGFPMLDTLTNHS